MAEAISLKEARRIAIHAQGLAGPRPARPGRAAVNRLARRLGAIQIDSVNVVARAHYLPPFARLGGYDTAVLDRQAWGQRPTLFEYWAHAVCLLPIEMQPLFRWRMADYRKPDFWLNPSGELKSTMDRVLAEIRARGGVTGGEFADERRAPGWWNWSAGKRALEVLFRVGEVSIATRRGFERVYDVTERVIPQDILNAPTPSDADAIDGLVTIAARALGVGAEPDIRDYFRISQRQCKAALARLTEAGVVEPVNVQGWKEHAWMVRGAEAPRRGAPGVLLSPFDNMIWFRDRVDRLFGVRFTIEIYTPADKRVHGYYVLMFLQGDVITARVDLKSDRKTGVLWVQAAHLEPDADEASTLDGLARELRAMAGWLGLSDIAVAKKGGLSAALSKKIG
ncbi:MAG: winged helix-turn-helix domain-containing protein [Caulobacterales bacterium]